jgi:hypothetical protein
MLSWPPREAEVRAGKRRKAMAAATMRRKIGIGLVLAVILGEQGACRTGG